MYSTSLFLLYDNAGAIPIIINPIPMNNRRVNNIELINRGEIKINSNTPVIIGINFPSPSFGFLCIGSLCHNICSVGSRCSVNIVIAVATFRTVGF